MRQREPLASVSDVLNPEEFEGREHSLLSSEAVWDSLCAGLTDTKLTHASPPQESAQPRARTKGVAATSSDSTPAERVSATAVAAPLGSAAFAQSTQPILVVLLVGLPASGKSTFAERVVAEHPLGLTWIRVNQDESGSRRKCETDVRNALSFGMSVIIDRCNFDIVQRRTWLDIAAEMARALAASVHTFVLYFDVPVRKCIARALARENHPTINNANAQAVISRMKAMLTPPLADEGFGAIRVCDSDPAKTMHIFLTTLSTLVGTSNAGVLRLAPPGSATASVPAPRISAPAPPPVRASPPHADSIWPGGDVSAPPKSLPGYMGGAPPGYDFGIPRMGLQTVPPPFRQYVFDTSSTLPLWSPSPFFPLDSPWATPPGSSSFAHSAPPRPTALRLDAPAWSP